MNAPVLRRLRKSASTVAAVPTFRIVVFGQSGVGKTAMSVRFVTKRFIGEYDPTLENIYQHYYMRGGSNVLFEIMDTAGQEENEMMMEEKMRWADAFILVYAINDQTSFEEIPRLKFTIAHTIARLNQQHKQVQPDPMIAIVGNKTDLEPDRMVSREDGETLANSLRCNFHEISVRDGLSDVIHVFHNIHDEYWAQMNAFRSISDSSSSNGRRKGKSFKYVDRIPRMEGKKRNYIFNDVSNGHYVMNDVASEIMTSKIDEDAEVSHNFQNFGTGSYFHRSTASLPCDVQYSPIETRPPARSRRNAVVGFSNGMQTSRTNSSPTNDTEHDNRRRQKLLKASHCSDNSLLQDSCHMNESDGNNNTNMTKPNRRCRSQENIDLSRSHSMVENFNKRAISFDVSNGLDKRFS